MRRPAQEWRGKGICSMQRGLYRRWILADAQHQIPFQGARLDGLVSIFNRPALVDWHPIQGFTRPYQGIVLPFPGRNLDEINTAIRCTNHVARFKNTRSEEHTSELQSQSNLVCR